VTRSPLRLLLCASLLALTALAAPTVYQVSPLDLRPDDQVPAAWQPLAGPLRLRAAPGQLEDLALALAGGEQALTGVTVAVSPLTAGDRVLHIPPERVYAVVCYYGPKGGISGPKDKAAPESYQYEPFALFHDAGIVQVDHAKRRTSLTQQGFLVDPPPLRPRDVPAGQMRQWYVTVPVPAEAAPGLYRGQLTIAAGGTTLATVALELEVLPIRLLPPAKLYAIYHNLSDLPLDDPRHLLMLRDLHEHGFDIPSLWFGAARAPGPDGRPVETFAQADRQMALLREAGMTPAFTFAIASSFINFWDANPAQDQPMARRLQQHWQERGYPPLVIYGMDEASGETLRRVASRYRTVQQEGIKVMAACSEGFFKETATALDYPILAGGLTPSELAVADVARAKQAGLTILSYSGPQLIYRNPLLYRVRTGFNLWTSIYDGWCPFTYAWGLKRHESGEIITLGCEATYKDHGVVIVGKERLISQVEWPAMRQGVDDVRYATTLAAQLLAARAAGLSAPVLAEAEAFLRQPGVNSGDFRSVEAARARTVDHILALQALSPQLATATLATQDPAGTARRVNDWIRPNLAFRPFPMGQQAVADALAALNADLAAGRPLPALLAGYALDRQLDALAAAGTLTAVEKVIAKGEVGPRILAAEQAALGVNPPDLAARFTVVAELNDGWRFRPDREDEGLAAKWFAPGTARDDWRTIDPQRFWQQQGQPDWLNLEGAQIGALGLGWYARRLTVPADWAGRPLYLWFKVDEEAMIWLDGRLVRLRNDGPTQERWNVPSLVDLGPALTPGDHELVFRVFNEAMAGGLWQGVRIITPKATP
jgi:hypothetical protein